MIVKQLVFAALLSLGLAGVAKAATPSTGLGQAWPNAPDVSTSPRWHAYVFEKDGIRYIQINDLAGHVHGAFATANGQYLVLPIGSDAATVTATAPAPAPATATATNAVAADTSAETVYDDGSTQVTVAVQADGTTLLSATAASAGCNENLPDCASSGQK